MCGGCVWRFCIWKGLGDTYGLIFGIGWRFPAQCNLPPRAGLRPHLVAAASPEPVC